VPSLESVPTAEPLDTAVHLRLAEWNRRRLEPAAPSAEWRRDLEEEHAMRLAEGVLIESARSRVADRAAGAPSDPEAFVAWFEALEVKGPGQHDPLFPWLASRADMDAMKWFLEQEAAGEAGFDDLVAMAQVKMPEQAKLELARNYWDEMGRGNPKGMHGKMLDGLVEALDLRPRIATTLWPSLALANTMTALATTRRYAWHALGALGVIELTAPGRAACVAQGLRRLGVRGDHRHYFDLHAVLDVRHSEAWNREVLHPLVAEDPDRARALAEGALIRLECGARCFEVYRQHLWNQPSASSIPQTKQEDRRWQIAS
jgi:hypothetical protein